MTSALASFRSPPEVIELDSGLVIPTTTIPVPGTNVPPISQQTSGASYCTPGTPDVYGNNAYFNCLDVINLHVWNSQTAGGLYGAANMAGTVSVNPGNSPTNFSNTWTAIWPNQTLGINATQGLAIPGLGTSTTITMLGLWWCTFNVAPAASPPTGTPVTLTVFPGVSGFNGSFANQWSVTMIGDTTNGFTFGLSMIAVMQQSFGQNNIFPRCTHNYSSAIAMGCRQFLFLYNMFPIQTT